ncbi:MAG TPA: hypothetical protein DEP42_02275 [Ruminococcaceae bacterium]|nr:hypothetical protein [Oscillospiraceae bacterium]
MFHTDLLKKGGYFGVKRGRDCPPFSFCYQLMHFSGKWAPHHQAEPGGHGPLFRPLRHTAFEETSRQQGGNKKHPNTPYKMRLDVFQTGDPLVWKWIMLCQLI